MCFTFGVRVPLVIAEVRRGMTARRALRELFCRFCGRELFSSRPVAGVYCSDSCANRDWARLGAALCLSVY